jgi:hypothetical protein
MARIAEDIALKFAEIGEHKLMEGIANQAASAFGDLGSSFAGLAAQALKAIAVGAGETAAGVSGFLAPVLGPAAVPAGLAAGAAIEAGAKGIGMMDIGAYNIPSTQLAMVHKNELVMPALEAGAFRSMLSGAAQGRGGGADGGVHNHFHISAVDSQSFVDMLRNHSSPLSRIVADATTRNPSLRGKY